jgi:hypothetical protein
MKAFTSRLAALTLLFWSICLVNAGEVAIPHEFTAGEKEVTAEVNENFDALETEVNDNDRRIRDNASAISDHDEVITQTKADVSDNSSAISSNASNISINITDISGILDRLDRVTTQLECASANYRFCDMGNGTVKDMSTGLIWLKDATCIDLSGTDANGKANWWDANDAAASLADGTCGLTDGSTAEDWRLPTKAEWEAFVVVDKYSNPVLCNSAGTAHWTDGNAFTKVQSSLYWSGTEYDTDYAWYVLITSGKQLYTAKGSSHNVWPVRSAD